MLKQSYWIIPLIAVLCITPWLSTIDLYLTHVIFSSEPKGFSRHPVVLFIDTWGHLPAILLCFTAGCIWLFSFVQQHLIFYRKAAFYIGFSLFLSFIMTYGVAKHTFCRPRPKEVVQFGGSRAFVPFYTSATTKNGRSFPSGHANTGCYFFTLFFIGKKYRNKTLIRIGALLGSFLGLFSSVCRLFQGEHFFSDVLFGGLIMWYTAYFLSALLVSKQRQQIRPLL